MGFFADWWHPEDRLKSIVKETCTVCGSDFDFYGMRALDAAAEWRAGHKCLPIRKIKVADGEALVEATAPRRYWDSGYVGRHKGEETS